MAADNEGFGALPIDEQEPLSPPSADDKTAITFDGNSIVVDFDPTKGENGLDPEDHDQNLAEVLEEDECRKLGAEILQMVEADEISRKQWFEVAKTGFELMGVTSVPKQNLPFDGASTVIHPLISEAVVQFQARSIAEIFPPAGPVKGAVIGPKTKQKEAQAQRVEDYMNWHLTEADPEYFWDTDQMLMYLPLAGSAFRKIYTDPLLEMEVARFVRVEEFIVPYTATSLRSAPRYTHVYEMTGNDVRRLQDKGFFCEADLSAVPYESDELREMLDQADRREASLAEKDETYKLYECHIDIALPDVDEEPRPYVITVEKSNGTVLSIYRNWKKDDKKFRKRIWFVHYKYLPGLGFYGFGLMHLIGSLSEAATGALRALLDSAAFANLQGGFKAKDVKLPGGTMTVAPGQWKDVETSSEDLRNAFFPLPFKEPSPALMQLFEFLVQAGQRFSSTTEAMVGEQNNTAPVGTTLAIIEQASKVYSAIHKRVHVAAREEFKRLAELIFENMPDEGYTNDVLGEQGLIFKQDFAPHIDVTPVSDPNITSSTQRITMAQSVMQLATQAPSMYDQREVHERMLTAMGVPDPDGVLVLDHPKRCDPVTENQLILTGKGVRAYPEQDHDSHLKAHQAFMVSISNQVGDQIQLIQPVMTAHLAEHYAQKYRLEAQKAMGEKLPPADIYDAKNLKELPLELENEIALRVAQAFQPTPAPTPEQQQAQAAQQQHEQQMAQAQEAHQQKMQHNQQLFEQAQAQKQSGFNVEQNIKQTGFQQEQQRKDAKVGQDLALDHAAAQQDAEHQAMQTSADISAGVTKAAIENHNKMKDGLLDRIIKLFKADSDIAATEKKTDAHVEATKKKAAAAPKAKKE